MRATWFYQVSNASFKPYSKKKKKVIVKKSSECTWIWEARNQIYIFFFLKKKKIAEEMVIDQVSWKQSKNKTVRIGKYLSRQNT